ncbi:MAG: DEAD/DEAH box helicase [Bdellovibrionales bacterium]|nr:DEAD/DEAH box helicase [Bdellovibrionales bacterium]
MNVSIPLKKFSPDSLIAYKAFASLWTDHKLLIGDGEYVQLDADVALDRFVDLSKVMNSSSFVEAFIAKEEFDSLGHFLSEWFSGKDELKIESHSNLGHPNFKIQFIHRDAKGERIEVSLSEEADHRFFGPIGAGLAKIAQKIEGVDSHFQVVHEMKSFLGAQVESEEKIVFDPTLSALKTVDVEKFRPIVEESKVPGSFQVSLAVEDTSGTTQQINPNLINPKTNTIRCSDGAIIPYGPGESGFIDEIRSRQSMNRKQAERLAQSPEDLIPPGTDTSRLDLSEYHSRVLGFEPRKQQKLLEFSSSGIEWFSDLDGEPSLRVQDTTGKTVEMKLPSNDTIKNAIQKVTSQLKESRTNPSAYVPKLVPIDEHGQFVIQPTAESLLGLGVVETIAEKWAASPDLKKEKRAVEVAVIGEQNAKHTEDIADPVLLARQIDTVTDAKLDPHQVTGVEWLLEHMRRQRGGVILADEMGLGKTAQMLVAMGILYDLIRSQGSTPMFRALPVWRPVLVVAPKILLTNWIREAGRFLKKDVLPKREIVGSSIIHSLLGDGGKDPSKLLELDLIAMNYETLASYQRELLRLDFSVVVFDESQNIKNQDTAKSIAARAVKSFLPICSTGTPVENSLSDLWTQIDATNRIPVNPLGTSKDFTADKRNSAERLTEIRAQLDFQSKKTIILRREKSILKNFPKKVIHPPVVHSMTAEQAAREENLTRALKGSPLELMTELRKLYQHPILLLKSANSSSLSVKQLIEKGPKLAATIEILNRIKGREQKVLIFTPSVPMQAILARVIAEEFGVVVNIINGETNQRGAPGEAAEKIIEDFSASDGFGALVLSPLAAGAGLNITAANHVIHYGRWWNPAKEDQATDRAYRRGQRLDVNVYYPILSNLEGKGFDVGLHELVERKRALARDFLDPIESFNITQTEMEEISKGQV